MTQFSIAAPELARLTHNALAFMPARSAVGACRLTIGRDRGTPVLEITATDLYAAGKDFAELDDFPRGTFETIDLSRENLVTFDKIARAKKKDEVRIEIRHQDGMSVLDDNGAWMPFLDASDRRQPVDLWERVDETLTRLERVSPVIPEFLMIDPSIMAKFAKVKCSGETICDLYIAGPDEPILVKIGSTFRGAIMPVSRDEAVASDLIGPEGGWDFS
ncbi:hypothetical protein [Kitasatospora mediocidica]|uniref:hypothetical protein n=1 Tax=Kitasatospora mediocidica TaxID=58352 RepID=UPI0005611A06|nr:hypothetical protein [Kitasatospora mediocidica]